MTQAEKLEMTQAEKIEQVIDWILQRNSDHAVRSSIAEEWPSESADGLIATALKKIHDAGGMQSETLRHIFNQMMKIGDYPGAMRALKEIEQAGAESPISQGELASGLAVETDTEAASTAISLLEEIDLEATPEQIADYIPPDKRIPRMGQTSREELEFRYEQVAQWISLDKKKSEVKRLAYAKWGIKPRTFENYYSAAYKILRDAADITPDESFAKAVRFYEHVIANDETEYKDKIAARKALDELLGIQKPRKTVQVGKDGQAVDPANGGTVNLTVVMNQLATSDLSDEQLQKLIAANEVYEAVSSGTKGGQNGSNSNSPTPSRPA